MSARRVASEYLLRHDTCNHTYLRLPPDSAIFRFSFLRMILSLFSLFLLEAMDFGVRALDGGVDALDITSRLLVSIYRLNNLLFTA
jgi:hypothetical protein